MGSASSSSSSSGRSLWKDVSILHSDFREKSTAALSPRLPFYSLGGTLARRMFKEIAKAAAAPVKPACVPSTRQAERKAFRPLSALPKSRCAPAAGRAVRGATNLDMAQHDSWEVAAIECS
jgi:hypothetical protein